MCMFPPLTTVASCYLCTMFVMYCTQNTNHFFHLERNSFIMISKQLSTYSMFHLICAINVKLIMFHYTNTHTHTFLYYSSEVLHEQLCQIYGPWILKYNKHLNRYTQPWQAQCRKKKLLNKLGKTPLLTDFIQLWHRTYFKQINSVQGIV
jgi:hypothetical protein